MKYLLKGLKNIAPLLATTKAHQLVPTLLNYSCAFLKLTSHVPQPTEVQIEPSSACNLKCKMCSIDNSVAKTFMSPSDLSQILRPLRHLRSINFTGIGESLLNTNLEQLIDAASEQAVTTSFITNGLLLNESRIHSLLNTRVCAISVSIESGIPEVYQRIRRGGLFDNLVLKLDLLNRRIAERKAPLTIYFNVVLLKETMDQIENIYSIIDLAAGLKNISGLTFQNPHDLSQQETLQYYSPGGGKNITAIFESIKAYAQARHVKVMLPSTTIKRGSCFYPWMYPFITVFGDVLPCCVIPQFGSYSNIIKEYSFGNLFQTPFDKLWNGERARLFRAEMAHSPPPCCQRCSKYLNIL